MSSDARIPDILEHLIRLPPEASLLVLTGIVNASQHWVITRFLGRFLGHASRRGNAQHGEADIDGQEEGEDNVGVVLVSWMRDYTFWQTEARRGAGIDLASLCSKRRFAFVDGLANLYLPEEPAPAPPKMPPGLASASTHPLPAGRNALPHRGPGPVPPRGPGHAAPRIPTERRKGPPPGISTLTSPALEAIQLTITAAINSLKPQNKHVFLILDAPTLLLATQPDIMPHSLTRFLLSLRSQVHSTLLSVEADAPLVSAASPGSFAKGDYTSSGTSSGSYMGTGTVPTPLEAKHASFVVGMAHEARWVMSLRGLDTGAAKDVSGVLSVRRGGACDEADGQREHGGSIKDMDVLYRVAMDGSVKVFERGAGDIG